MSITSITTLEDYFSTRPTWDSSDELPIFRTDAIHPMTEKSHREYIADLTQMGALRDSEFAAILINRNTYPHSVVTTSRKNHLKDMIVGYILKADADRLRKGYDSNLEVERLSA